MTDTENKVRSDRNERLKSALRDNLKRRKMQARGRAGQAIVTPEDDAKFHDGERSAGPDRRGER